MTIHFFSYRENIKKLSSVFTDQPDDPLTRGVFWCEYVLRHKGAPQLQSAAKKLNFVQYHSIDVLAAYLTIIVTVLYILYAVLRCIGKFICSKVCSSKSTKVVDKKKKNK
jgi:glucuronosyltransferase